MYSCVRNCVFYGKMKVDGFFRRLFKEEAGGAELIATLIIIGIVLILAFAFKDKLAELVKNIWNNLIVNGSQDTNQKDVGTEWK